jgi:hypothetical protein
LRILKYCAKLNEEMNTKPLAYLGYNISNDHLPFNCCILDPSLKIVKLEPSSLEEALAQALSFPSAFVAVNAPSHPNKGLMKMAEVRSRLSPTPSRGHWTNLRLLEYELRRRGICAPRTPASANDCPSWMRNGFVFYHRLQEGGFQAFPTDEFPQQWLETQSETVFHSLLGEGLMDGRTLEGRLQRQMILYAKGLSIRDPMSFFEEVTGHRLMHGHLPMDMVYSLGELNAMAAAFTAWLSANRPHQVIRLGALDEGQAVIPASHEFEVAIQNLAEFHQMSFFNLSNAQE